MIKVMENITIAHWQQLYNMGAIYRLRRYQEIARYKQAALDNRYALNPERFVNGVPTIQLPPSQVMINPVSALDLEQGVSSAVNFPTLNRVKEKITLSSN